MLRIRSCLPSLSRSYRTSIFVCIWLSIAVLIAGVVCLSLKKPPRPTRANRSASTASAMPPQNPFDDPSGEAATDLNSPTKPNFARSYTGEDVEAARVSGAAVVEEQPRRKGQGWLGRLFGGLPDAAAAPLDSASSAPAPTSALPVPQQRRRAGDDGDSVLASERTSERGAEELEMDEVDQLGRYAPSSSAASTKSGRYGVGADEDDFDDDFGEFEKATGAVQVHEVGEGRDRH